MRLALVSLVTLAVVSFSADAADKKLLMLAGKPSHGYMEHEYRAGCLLLQQCLANTPGFQLPVLAGAVMPPRELPYTGPTNGRV